ncbi:MULTISPECIES: hypothetical protein [Pseudomonas syringae group genomosp. 2]|uniref:Uncharacterized protein n=1 Tax=Pseudomonas savastanoi pv. savastanoi NCPPB 3335 TaxID=693985 RepID=A0ABC8BBI8_PSESS|nr:hypothetical protein [Pseudomonas savastanoi]ARD11402.1 hypothetical protein PSA3335_10185 [Pseudomonas savastanoi pv. savastanoi NCPPB 3335]MBA4702957.1 hypothetical protein [Pseudomonas savastanoi pv. savastanoi]RMN71241.1 hypothetical protein ALQ55_01165 [Pseudomonas savastanoi pv. savastanoi]
MRLKNSFSQFMDVFLMAEAGTEGSPGGGPAPAPAPAPAAPAPAPAPGSVLANVAGSDYIPEKYRTNKEDGTLDLEASSRKMSEAYKHLETRLGSGDAPPKTAEEYAPKVEIEGFNWEEFKADESTQSFLKGAHAKGLTNDQVSFVIGEYMRVAPELVGGAAQLTSQDCTATLKTLWPDDQAMTGNLQSSYRAAQAFAGEAGKPGSFEALMSKYGNDPDFIAFTANIGKEIREDSQINGGNVVNDGDFDVKTSELRGQIQALPAHDPKLPGLRQQLNDMYNSRYNKPASRLVTK